MVALWTTGRGLSVMIKCRHPEVQAEIDRVYQEHLAKGLAKGGVTRQRKTIDCGKADIVQHPTTSSLVGRGAFTFMHTEAPRAERITGECVGSEESR